jgi:TonB family protein
VIRKCVALSLLLAANCLAAESEPYLKSAPMPFYPRTARLARLSAQVRLNFLVDQNGNTSEIGAEVKTDAPNGASFLRDDAIENVRGWKFAWPQPCSCRSKREAIFIYKFSGQLESPERPNVTVRWFGKTDVIRVEIEGDLVEHSD